MTNRQTRQLLARTQSAEAWQRRGALPGATLLLPTHEQIPILEIKRDSLKNS